MRQRLGLMGRALSRQLSLPRHHLTTHLAEFARLVGPMPLILDIGSGRLAPYRPLFQYDRYLTLDYFEQADVRADGENLPFASGVARLALATEVFEHLPNPPQALAEIRRVLEEGGYLLITVPLIWGVHDYVDYQRWTARGLAKLLDEAGFEIVRLKHRGGIFSMIGCMTAQIPAQLFGPMAQQQRWWVAAVYALSWAMLAPLPWLGSLLDHFDRAQDFTLGYSVLCRKKL
ncbi:MAG: methyltransferase domain-containing protein [Chloroflexota bacterium]